MKKYFLILILNIITLVSYSQAPTFATGFDMSADKDIVLKVENDNMAWAIQVVCTGVTGTLDGTVSIYTSLDGEHYHLYESNFVDTINNATWGTQFADKYLSEYYIKISYKHNNITGGKFYGYYLFNNTK